MSDMEKNFLKIKLLSNHNIFLAIFLCPSYIQDPKLLSDDDYKLFNELRDTFNYDLIQNTIQKIRDKIENILNQEESFFSINVFFKPKEIDEKNNIKFRPLHSASLLDQIAMIAMIQVLIFDLKKEGNIYELVPSEISRIIPTCFYGNRISYNGKELFKPWQDQYHQYTSKANELAYTYQKTQEYTHEINLDLKNFFPSVNPKITHQIIYSLLPMRYTDEERKLADTIIRKLLYFKVPLALKNSLNNENGLNKTELEWYLVKQDICEIVNTQKQKEYFFAKGLPQGLPHVYYFANIVMLKIYDIYKEVLHGEMLFYVDDSVIFTKIETTHDLMVTFESKIKTINEKIKIICDGLLKTYNSFKSISIPGYSYRDLDFSIEVHDANHKSHISALSSSAYISGDTFLSGLCRETSIINPDIYFATLDEDHESVKNRAKILYEAVENELANKKIPKNDLYRKKLFRYKKFFKYRYQILNFYMNGDISSLIDILKNLLYPKLKDSSCKKAKDKQDNNGSKTSIKADFLTAYKDDILAALSSFICRKELDKEDIKDIRHLKRLISRIFYNNNINHSYIHCFLQNSTYLQKDNAHYSSLLAHLKKNYHHIRRLSYNLKISHIKKACELLTSISNGMSFADPNYILSYIRTSTSVKPLYQELLRRYINAFVSYLLCLNIDDNFIFSKNDQLPIKYSELRLLSFIRNPTCKLEDLQRNMEDYFCEDFCEAIDYSILQVMDLFRKLVIAPEQIDRLILLHKYCSDTWKNGSKHLYFYTLHNQEHATTLIMNACRLTHDIACLKIKTFDYYILFSSCYLHDISMVSLPEYDNYIIKNTLRENTIQSDFLSNLLNLEGNHQVLENIHAKNLKKCLCQTYKQLDEYYEWLVRSNHAKDSADEIRFFPELSFLPVMDREIIANVSANHGADLVNIYQTSSNAKSSLYSYKLVSIMLRLCDLLDLSRHRISKIIFDHNLKRLGEVSRFHWISHLLTDDYKLNINYERSSLASSQTSFLNPKSIIEKITFTINVLMSQTTAIKNSSPCENILNCELSSHSRYPTIILQLKHKNKCPQKECPFLCKWFCKKNEYLISEFSALQDYLNSLDYNFFNSKIVIKINVISNNKIPNDIFDYLNDYLHK